MTKNTKEHWNQIKLKKPNKQLTFIHTPKCGGTYVSLILDSLNIRKKGNICKHIQASEHDGITFTVVRDPIKRFESLLNYRLCEDKPRGHDWPTSLNYVYQDKSVSLDTIVEKMTDNEITNFSPYRSLVYWSKNVDIFITIDQLPEFLSFFGYKYNVSNFSPTNISKKERGTFNEFTINRLKLLYIDDLEFYSQVIKN
jgi:hypothetical protein